MLHSTRPYLTLNLAALAIAAFATGISVEPTIDEFGWMIAGLVVGPTAMAVVLAFTPLTKTRKYFVAIASALAAPQVFLVCLNAWVLPLVFVYWVPLALVLLSTLFADPKRSELTT